MNAAALLTALLVLPARATVDDSDLSGGAIPGTLSTLRAESLPGTGGRRFPLEQLRAGGSSPAGLTISGRFLLSDAQGRDLPASLAAAVLFDGSKEVARAPIGLDGTWIMAAPHPGRYTAVLRLENAYWSITDEDSGKPYEWKAGEADLSTGGSVDLGDARPDPNSANGHIPLIHLQFQEAVGLFNRLGLDLTWWNKSLKVGYPAASDYFSPWSFAVHLSRPEAWDVNLHELGHAVMSAGMRARGGGGEHKIDACYSAGLALSEGWATFFAAAVRLSPDDADARFQYLVPRRAPIRIENVPEDVCRGETNEWRVAAGFWDLYDSHPDGGDGVNLGFSSLWDSLKDGSMGSFADAWRLIRRTLPAGTAEAAARAVEQNSLPSTAGPALALPRFD